MSARILLVEDDPVSRDLLAALLASKGHLVDTAEDGFNALRLAQETPYDLVFLDYHLPEMDGYALARLIRSLAEKTGTTLKMVAITADRFGLAARRGADTVFDHMLAKPIDPDALFAFVATLVPEAKPPALDALDSFLSGSASTAMANDAQSAAQVLWRVRGIGALPKAAVFPAPSAAQKTSLEYCFRLVEQDQAECLILLSDAGLAAVERHRAQGTNYLQPLLTIDAALMPRAEAHFGVGDGESWSTAASVLTSFASRQEDLMATARASKEFDVRLTAYLHVADRPLVLQRDDLGRTTLPYTGGFAAPAVIDAVRRLAAQGAVMVRPGDASKGGQRELHVLLTARGSSTVAHAQTVSLSAS